MLIVSISFYFDLAGFYFALMFMESSPFYKLTQMYFLFSQMNIGDVCECVFPGGESESECLSAIGLFGSRPGYAAVAAETVFTR